MIFPQSTLIMAQSKDTPLLDPEFEVFKALEDKIDQILKRLADMKEQRDKALQQKTELESLLRRRETQIAQLQDSLATAQKRALSPEKEKLIKDKLRGLVDRLQEF
jgi:hypothetical protein